MSLGVPGMRKAMKAKVSTFFSSRMKRSESIFSRGKKTSIALMPHLRTNRNTSTLPITSPTTHRSVPQNVPNAYPATISNGSPGMNATMI